MIARDELIGAVVMGLAMSYAVASATLTKATATDADRISASARSRSASVGFSVVLHGVDGSVQTCPASGAAYDGGANALTVSGVACPPDKVFSSGFDR